MESENPVTKSLINCHIFKIFYENYVCMRCCLRLLKISQIDLYRDKEFFLTTLNIISEKLNLEQNLLCSYDFENLIMKSHNSKANVCSICLGILQLQDKEENLKDLIEKVKNEEYEFSSFKLTLKIPLSTTIRAYQNFIDVKVGFKWIIGPQLSLAFNCKPNTDEKFCINIIYGLEDDEKDYFSKFSEVLKMMHEEDYEKKMIKKKRKFDKHQMPKPNIDSSHNNLDKILSLQNEYFFVILGKLPPKPSEIIFKFDVNCSYQNMFIIGNYLKFSRIISQTPWIIDEKMMYDSSIQEEISRVISDFYKSEISKFHSGGREDIDVRMLGNGRPFAIELVNPKRALSVKEEHLIEMENRINKSKDVHVNSLRFSDESCFEIMKQYESAKIKAYVCVVRCQNEIQEDDIKLLNAQTNLKLDQKTPLRVLHRRTLMIREKFIYKMKAVKINSRFMVLYVLASAGTYIKEFVHGDLNRTNPNVGTLINNVSDILQLDVLKLYEKLDNEVIEDFMDSSKVVNELKIEKIPLQ